MKQLIIVGILAVAGLLYWHFNNRQQKQPLLPQAVAYMPDSEGVGYNIAQDSVIYLNEFGVKLEFTSCTQKEFDQYDIQFETSDVSNILPGTKQSDTRSVVKNLLRDPKLLAQQNLIPIIDWDQKLSVLRNADQVIEKSMLTYMGNSMDIQSEMEEEEECGGGDENTEKTNLMAIDVFWFVLQELGILNQRYFNRTDKNAFELITDKGVKRYANVAKDSLEYFFLGYYHNINAFMIGSQTPDEQNYWLVNKNSGLITEVWDIPEFWNLAVKKWGVYPVISQGSYQLPQKPTGIQILQLKEGTSQLAFELRMKAVLPSQIVFKDPETAYIKLQYDYGYRKMKISRY